MEQWQRKIRDDVARKLRMTAIEFGQDAVKNAIVIGDFKPYDWITDIIAGNRLLYAPTISIYTLGNVDYKVARFFEDA